MRFPRKRLTVVLALSAAAAAPLSAQAHQKPRTGSAASTTQPSAPAGGADSSSGPQGQADPGSLGLAPQVTVVVSPTAPQVGALVHLTVTGGRSGISDYRWDLTGVGAFARDTGGAPTITTQFDTPGAHRVGVELRTTAGWDHAGTIIHVSDRTPSAAPAVPPTPAPGKAHRTKRHASQEANGHGGHHTPNQSGAARSSRGDGERTSRADGKPTSRADGKPASRADGKRTSRAGAAPASHSGGSGVTFAVHSGAARAAGDPPVTIADFNFSPGTTTIHTGDTITWSNNGPSPHSATAKDGSFNTGILQKGQSGSHTFTQAGTFSYYCTVHPFMHGTVVVLASNSSGSQTGGSQTGSTGSGSGSQGGQNGTSSPSSGTGSTGSTGSTGGTASAGTPSATTAASTPSLPNTGLSLVAAFVVAIALLGGGLALRRIASR